MALRMSSGQGVPFYDPFYKVNTNRSSACEESNSRYYDDFSVFNSLHIPRPQSLSLNTKSRSPLDTSVNKPRQRIDTTSTGVEIKSKSVVDEKIASLPSADDAGKENLVKALENLVDATCTFTYSNSSSTWIPKFEAVNVEVTIHDDRSVMAWSLPLALSVRVSLTPGWYGANYQEVSDRAR